MVRTGSVPVSGATERKRLSEITGAVCPVAEEKHQRGELEKPHHQLLETYTSLNRQYAELQSEYKHLRAVFWRDGAGAVHGCVDA